MDESDVDVNLLSELLELAEKDEPHVSDEKSPEAQSFDSMLEDLDKIPVKLSSRTKLVDKTSHFNNDLNNVSTKGRNTSSVVHSGATDSSDDEEIRQNGSSVDSFGANIKRMLKTAEEEKKSAPRLLDTNRPFQNVTSWKSSISKSSSSLCLPEKKKIGPMDAYLDSSVGIRIINPLISSSVIKERLVGRKVVSMSQVKQFTSDGKMADDWVIFGAIVSKTPPRTSAKGSSYSIVRISDLRGPGNPKMVSLFMFSSAFKKHGKDTLGTVLGILNPGVMDNSRNHGDEACLSVDNTDRIMVLGTSKDFGLCKSKKKNGENCTSIVNTALCEFCVYHVKQEYQKCSRRSDLQSSFNGPGLSNLRNKVLGKNEVFYGGQSYCAVPAKYNKKQTEKDNSRLSRLSGKTISTSAMNTKPSGKVGIASSVELSLRQSQKDVDRLRKLILDDSKLLDKQTSSIVTASFNANEVKPDEAKNAALALISEKKSQDASNSNSKINGDCLDELRCSPNSSIIKDAAVVTESVAVSRGVKVTLALSQRKQSKGNLTASSLGLGQSSKSEKNLADGKDKQLKPITPSSTQRASCKQAQESSSGSMHQTANNLKPVGNSETTTKPALSSQQLLKLALSSQDLESRMLKQAAQKAAMKEEAAKTNPHATPSMLGLGRSLSVGLNGSSPMLPKLGKGLHSSAIIDLNVPISKKISNSAKLNAINIIKSQGGISKNDPNFREFESRKKPDKESLASKRPREVSPCTAVKNLKRLKPSLSELDEELKVRKAKFKELMEKTSCHTNLIEAAENEAQDEYFGKLEKKEQMEEKMLNTFKVACKAVRCLTCKYTSFSASEMCKTERHPLKVTDATKRFFKCADCGNRTVSLEVIPMVSCSNCSSSRWERAAMIRERKVGVTQETLSVRGMEETFIGSVTTGANLNLLVPEGGT